MNTPLNLVYIGSPVFSAQVLTRILNELKASVVVTAVLTQPDRPVGRKQVLTQTPVKEVASVHGIPVYVDSNDTRVQSLLASCDLALLYAYGLILNEKMLKLPRWGFWNIHPSLLPTYRGTSPIAYALLMGDAKTGVSLMEMDSRMDHGPILAQKEYSIQAGDTRTLLENRLSDIGYELFKLNIQLLSNGLLHKSDQNHIKATFTRLLTKKDGYIPYTVFKKMVRGEELAKEDTPSIIAEYQKKYSSLSTLACPSKPSDSYVRSGDFRLSTFHLFRGLSPWPGVWTILPNEKRLKITGMEVLNGKPLITRVQLEGKKEVALPAFLINEKI